MMRWPRSVEPFVREYERARIHLGAPWRDVEYLALDFETTGLDLQRDDVVSYGVVPVVQGRVRVGEQEESLVLPTQPVPAHSSVVHHIRNVDLDGAPDARCASARLIELLTGRVLLAHASWVETAFLNRLLRLHGTRTVVPVIDTACLARALSLSPRVGAHEPHLESLAMSVGLPVHDPHHAIGDALTTAQLFLVLAARLERRDGPLSLSALLKISRDHTLHRG